jgi:hypothetical protein
VAASEAAFSFAARLVVLPAGNSSQLTSWIVVAIASAGDWTRSVDVAEARLPSVKVTVTVGRKMPARV